LRFSEYYAVQGRFTRPPPVSTRILTTDGLHYPLEIAFCFTVSFFLVYKPFPCGGRLKPPGKASSQPSHAFFRSSSLFSPWSSRASGFLFFSGDPYHVFSWENLNSTSWFSNFFSNRAYIARVFPRKQIPVTTPQAKRVTPPRQGLSGTFCSLFRPFGTFSASTFKILPSAYPKVVV